MAMAAIAGVRVSLPKKVSMNMASFSIAAAVRIGPRVSGKRGVDRQRAHNEQQGSPVARKEYRDGAGIR